VACGNRKKNAKFEFEFEMAFSNMHVITRDERHTFSLSQTQTHPFLSHCRFAAFALEIMDSFDNFQYDTTSSYGGMGIVDDTSSVYTSNTQVTSTSR
jgi:hypothetical protein